jgi:uncharacterized protein DUF4056
MQTGGRDSKERARVEWRALAMLGVALALAALLAGAPGCATRQKWEGGPIARPELIAQEFSPQLISGSATPQIPTIAQPRRLRPCCAFGTDLHVKLGAVPVAGLSLANVIGADDLGPHEYDNGAISLEQSRPGGELISIEHNGLIYTCRGGFVDTAHLRDWADWTLYLSTVIARTLETGTTIELPDEGGQRRIVTQPLHPLRVAGYGSWPVAVPLAQWLAFQMSVWHEIATWYGWSSTFFSEQASAFSPEDLYSNMLGIKTAAVLIYGNQVTSEAAYNEGINGSIAGLLQLFGATPGDVGRLAMRSVDGVWWDSTTALPDKRLVLRRNMNYGVPLTPWLASRAQPSREVNRQIAEYCGNRDTPIVLEIPDDYAGMPFSEKVQLQIDVSDDLAASLPLPHPGSRRLTQEDFPTMISHIRAENEQEFGQGADRP